MWPCYLDLGTAEIRRRAERAIEGLRDCRVCPRDCRVDRTRERPAEGDRVRGKQPVCRTWRHAFVGS